MTDNIVYVGSSNYSEESAHNFESGFISRDKAFIEFLEDEVFPLVIDYSSEYTSDEELLLLEVAILKSVAMFEEIYETYRNCFYSLSGHRGIEKWYYNTTEPRLLASDIEKTQEIAQKYLELLVKVNKIFNYKVIEKQEKKDISSTILVVTTIIEYMDSLFEGKIDDLANYNGQAYIDEYMEEHYAEAYDEYLDEHMENAMDIANDAFSDLSEEVREEADELLVQIKLLIELSKKVMIRYIELPKTNIKIDNTKK